MRQLEREIGTVCRKVARQVAEGKAKRKVTITEPRVRELLGKRALLLRDPPAHVAARASPPGWPGLRSAARCCSSRPPRCRAEGGLTITGQLGDVMQESAQAALSYVRSNAASSCPSCPRTGSPSTISTSTCPPARRPRTARAPGWRWSRRWPRCSPGGPSARDVAMTGEITLTGQVLPIGGLKEKALAAQRGGIKTVIAPALQRAGHRRDPRASAQGPRVPLRLRRQRGARDRAAAEGGPPRRSVVDIFTSPACG